MLYTYTPAEMVFGINGALTYLSSPGEVASLEPKARSAEEKILSEN